MSLPHNLTTILECRAERKHYAFAELTVFVEEVEAHEYC